MQLDQIILKHVYIQDSVVNMQHNYVDLQENSKNKSLKKPQIYMYRLYVTSTMLDANYLYRYAI